MLREANAGLGLFILRLILGFVFLMHGLGKLVGPPFGGSGIDATIQYFTGIGLPMPTVFAWGLGLADVLGGIALVLGAATKTASAVLALEILIAMVKIHFSQGFAIGVEKWGYEYSLTLFGGLLCVFFAGP